MTSDLLTEVLIALLLLGFFVFLIVRMGVHRNLLVRLEDMGFGAATKYVIILASLVGLALLLLLGSGDIDRFQTPTNYIGLLLFLTGTVLVGIATGRVNEYRRLSSVSATSLRDAQDGDTVAVTGTARAVDGETLQSPVTQTRCLAYEERLETKVRTIRFPSTFYAIEDRNRARSNFFLEDGTNSIVVDQEDAQIEMPLSEIPEAPESRLLLARLVGGVSAEAEANCRRRSERRLDPGITVGVLGRIIQRDGRQILHADAVFTDPRYEEMVRQSVQRNGAVGLGAICIGLVLLLGTLVMGIV